MGPRLKRSPWEPDHCVPPPRQCCQGKCPCRSRDGGLAHGCGHASTSAHCGACWGWVAHRMGSRNMGMSRGWVWLLWEEEHVGNIWKLPAFPASGDVALGRPESEQLQPPSPPAVSTCAHWKPAHLGPAGPRHHGDLTGPQMHEHHLTVHHVFMRPRLSAKCSAGHWGAAVSPQPQVWTQSSHADSAASPALPPVSPADPASGKLSLSPLHRRPGQDQSSPVSPLVPPRPEVFP